MKSIKADIKHYHRLINDEKLKNKFMFFNSTPTKIEKEIFFNYGLPCTLENRIKLYKKASCNKSYKDIIAFIKSLAFIYHNSVVNSDLVILSLSRDNKSNPYDVLPLLNIPVCEYTCFLYNLIFENFSPEMIVEDFYLIIKLNISDLLCNISSPFDIPTLIHFKNDLFFEKFNFFNLFVEKIKNNPTLSFIPVKRPLHDYVFDNPSLIDEDFLLEPVINNNTINDINSHKIKKVKEIDNENLLKINNFYIKSINIIEKSKIEIEIYHDYNFSYKIEKSIYMKISEFSKILKTQVKYENIIRNKILQNISSNKQRSYEISMILILGHDLFFNECELIVEQEKDDFTLENYYILRDINILKNYPEDNTVPELKITSDKSILNEKLNDELFKLEKSYSFYIFLRESGVSHNDSIKYCGLIEKRLFNIAQIGFNL